jgi:hypothetical protein
MGVAAWVGEPQLSPVQGWLSAGRGIGTRGDRRDPGMGLGDDGIDSASAMLSSSSHLGHQLSLGATFTGTAIPAPATIPAAGPLGGGGFTRAQRAPLLEHHDRLPKIGDVSGDTAHPELVLILHHTGDRPRPTARGHRRDRPFTLGPPPGLRCPIPSARPDPGRQLSPIHHRRTP